MMTMSSISDTLAPPDPSKSAFLEFGGHGYPGHQQPSPGLSHYPVHGLHAVGPSQHHGHFSSGAATYGRPLGYPGYHSPVSAHHPGTYLSYQHGGHGGPPGHSRLDDAGRFHRTFLNRKRCMFALMFCLLHVCPINVYPEPQHVGPEQPRGRRGCSACRFTDGAPSK